MRNGYVYKCEENRAKSCSKFKCTVEKGHKRKNKQMELHLHKKLFTAKKPSTKCRGYY